MLLLRMLRLLLPAAFRRDHGAEMLATAHDRWRELRPGLDRWRRYRFWIRQWLAVLRIAVVLRTGRGLIGGTERRQARRGGARVGAGFGWQEVRQTVRGLARRPAFTVVTVLTLGLGVGAVTATFSVVDAVLLRPLPYPEADALVVLFQTDRRDGSVALGISAANLRDVAARAKTLVAAAVVQDHGLALQADGRAISLRGWMVSAGFFDALGVAPQLGRTFRPPAYQPGGDTVVLLGHRCWQTRFGGDPGVLDRTVVLDGVAHTVVGVMPPGFRYPGDADFWVPRPPRSWDEDARSRARLGSIARLAPGVDLDRAEAEIDRIAAELSADHPAANAGLGLRMVRLERQLVGEVASPLLLLLGAVGLVLAIAAANVAGLQLVRASRRAREHALCGALGASRGRILRMVGLESLLLAGAGGAVGIGLASLGIDAVRVLGPDRLPRLEEMRIDPPVLAVALLAALVSALLAGIAPALRATRADLRTLLSSGARGGTPGPRAGRARDRLVVAEIAIALVLATGAGLLLRSFDRLLGAELGFAPEGLLAVQVFAFDRDHRPNDAFFLRGREAIEALPGVEAVGLTTFLPGADGRSFWSGLGIARITVEGRAAPERGREPVAGFLAISDSYPAAMGIALHSGRVFSPRDRPGSVPVTMVNESFVRRHFRGRDPIGARITLDRAPAVAREIVGVLADVRPRGFASAPRPEVYLPLTQAPAGSLTFVIRTTVAPAALVREVEETIWHADPSQAIWAARPMSDLLAEWTRPRRFATALSTAFACVALALAAIGVYGLISFTVEQRRGELGIRRALGGRHADLLATVLRRGLKLGLLGAALGLLAASALTRWLEGMLFEVDAFDPAAWAASTLAVIGAAAVAAYLPARRAMRVDPAEALRSE